MHTHRILLAFDLPCRKNTFILQRPEILLTEQQGPSGHCPYLVQKFPRETLSEVSRGICCQCKAVFQNPLKIRTHGDLCLLSQYTDGISCQTIQKFRSVSQVQHKQLKIYPNHVGHHKDHLYPSFFKASPFTSLLFLPYQRGLYPSASHGRIKQVHVLFEGLLADVSSTPLRGIQKTGECFDDISRNISFSYRFISLQSSYEPALGLCMGENTVSGH